jgi:transposase
LTPTEVQKYAVIDRALKGEVTVERAAQVWGLCERQVYRLKAKVKVAGSRGVPHGNRGQLSKRKLPRDKEARILQLARTTYRGFNDHHLTEKFQRREGIHVSRETVRRLLRAQGIGPRRSRRERKPQAGMMLQCDGSLHDWLEGRGPQLCLLPLGPASRNPESRGRNIGSSSKCKLRANRGRRQARSAHVLLPELPGAFCPVSTTRVWRTARASRVEDPGTTTHDPALPGTLCSSGGCRAGGDAQKDVDKPGHHGGALGC